MKKQTSHGIAGYISAGAALCALVGCTDESRASLPKTAYEGPVLEYRLPDDFKQMIGVGGRKFTLLLTYESNSGELRTQEYHGSAPNNIKWVRGVERENGV